VVLSHSTFYKLKEDQTCDGLNPPPVISWHIHIVYMLTNPDEITGAMVLRNKTIEHFKDHLGPDCPHRFDNGRLCMIIDHDFNTTLDVGPFPVGEWSIFVPLSHFSVIVPWLAQHRGQFSYLVHPNTGCEYNDHSTWAFWVGQAWPIDLSIFPKGEKDAEDGHYPGDTANPTCITQNTNCGSPEFPGPAIPCCHGNHCSCDPVTLRNCKCAPLKGNLKYLA